MNTKVLVLLSLLIGMGAVLHSVIPGVFGGMKPDLMLTMMFLGIMLFPNKKNVLLLSIVAGLISALTTQFPGGQLPNIIDKLITAFVFYGLFLLVGKFAKSTMGAIVIATIGTMISGVIFLSSALLIAGLPGSATFVGLFIGVVLPTTALSAIAMLIIYPIAQQLIKRANLPIQA
ncbi:tryptophan transporter [Litchfieldia salsa]|uniref:Tryptophan transporter TrpP n=1 Tax=Litchfieldia salsa TaxID=930152 RepID=A0A1H0UVF0_9BACI|nr:tryptophan transporter [Litchfieldia salsa]SDP70212.1 Tryptophan transporter TrpP [Litchfieldia salsa]